MSRVLAFLLAAVVLAVAAPARAFTPESGWWIAVNEPGYGFSIEIQDNFLFMVAFTYDANDPRPTRWVAAEGLMANNASFSAPLYSRSGGTCVGCEFRQPGPTVAIGSNMAISFDTETEATLTWAGRTLNIKRFDFFLSRNPAAQPRTELWLGEWQIVMDFSRYPQARDFPFFGEILKFDLLDTAGATDFFDGCRPANSLVAGCTNQALQDHPVSGYFCAGCGIDGEDVNFIIVEDDAQTNLVFEVVVGLTQFDGYAKRCLASIPGNQIIAQCLDNNNIPELPSRGWRSASRAFVQGNANAPSGADAGVAAAPATNALRSLPATVPAAPSATGARRPALERASEAMAQAVARVQARSAAASAR
jgi:hypothetical protein